MKKIVIAVVAMAGVLLGGAASAEPDAAAAKQLD